MSKAGRKSARFHLAVTVLLLGLAAVAYRLVDLQVVKAERFGRIAEEQRLHLAELKPRRGSLLDRNGEVLALSKEAYSIYATPYLVKDVEMTAAELSSVLGLPRWEIEEKLKSPGGFVYLQRKVDPETAQKVKALSLEGIGFERDSRRYYPHGDLAPQVIGFVGTDNVGLAGLELQYNDLLSGEAGEAALETDPSGEPIPGVTRVIKAPRDGCDVQLTIDSQIQFKLQEELARSVEDTGASWGSGVVMDCYTGDILAMAVVPSFDLNRFAETDPSLTRNRVVTDAYEPGSVLKVMTALAALENQVVAPGSIINIPAGIRIGEYTFRDAHPMPKSDLTFSEVITYSSNVGTIKVARALGEKALQEFLQRSGLGRVTGVDFPGENPGMVQPAGTWSATTLPTTAIGQGITVTSLQLAVLMAAVANGGMKVTPHFLYRVIHPDGGVDDYRSPEGERLVSPHVASTLGRILERVVKEGTGTAAAMQFYNCAGKTGTAMKPAPGGGYMEAYTATFAGFAPSEEPRLVAVITLDEPVPIYGGLSAAPCFSRVMEYALQRLEVPPSRERVNTRDVVEKSHEVERSGAGR